MRRDPQFSAYAPATGKLDIPLNVRSVGRRILKQGESMRGKRKWITELLWTEEGEGFFQVDETSYPVEEGDIFIYRPGDTHYREAVSARWICCWVAWDHPDALKWVEAFGLKKRVQHRESCPQWLFEEAATSLREGVPDGQRRAAHSSHAILVEASVERGKGPRENPIAESARLYLDTHFQETEVNMESLASFLQVHRTTLLRSFHSSYGISPSDYLHNRRMEYALGLLHRSNARIKDVAQRSGFSDSNYFSRAVKKALGMSPREFQLGANT